MTIGDNGQRGPAEHARREQIIEAADQHFRHYGYAKTTVADLAKAIGLSPAYIYKFFDSKKAIGEAICGMCLGKMASDLQFIACTETGPTERLRRVIQTLAKNSTELFFQDRKLHDIVVVAQEEKWLAVRRYQATLLSVTEHIVKAGRLSGDFERKTPLDEVANGILLALKPIYHPVLLAERLDELETDAALIASLILRSLAP